MLAKIDLVPTNSDGILKRLYHVK